MVSYSVLHLRNNFLVHVERSIRKITEFYTTLCSAKLDLFFFCCWIEEDPLLAPLSTCYYFPKCSMIFPKVLSSLSTLQLQASLLELFWATGAQPGEYHGSAGGSWGLVQPSGSCLRGTWGSTHCQVQPLACACLVGKCESRTGSPKGCLLPCLYWRSSVKHCDLGLCLTPLYQVDSIRDRLSFEGERQDLDHAARSCGSALLLWKDTSWLSKCVMAVWRNKALGCPGYATCIGAWFGSEINPTRLTFLFFFVFCSYLWWETGKRTGRKLARNRTAYLRVEISWPIYYHHHQLHLQIYFHLVSSLSA